ncbi:MAG: hypothetical protein ACTHJM_08160 [Marmoricola sp.]
MTENRRRWLYPLLAVATVVVAIALVTALLTSGGGARNTGAAPLPTPTATAPTPTPTPTPSPSPTNRLGAGIPTLTPAGGWGLADPAARHTLLIELVSSRPVYVQSGWRAPTSPDKGGVYKGRTTDWSHSTTVYGAPQYVVFYTYYGGAEAPVTCRVFVDGSLRTSKTSTGRYGGVMCVG